MATGDDLRAAILADPDDLGPRTVYADWLIAQGDPRGEHIALACASPESEEGELRRRALWQRHRDAWMMADLGPTGPSLGVGYANGLPDACDLPLATVIELARASASSTKTLKLLAIRSLTVWSMAGSAS